MKRVIKAPIHLSGNNENQFINIFKRINKEDWVFLHGEIITMHYLKLFQNLFKRKNSKNKKHISFQEI